MLHHAATIADWEARSPTGYRPAGLDSDGFVHCSTAAQLPGVLRRYYRSCDRLVVLSLDTAALTSDLVWEDTAGRGEAFPHVYGAIPLAAVVRAEEVAVCDISPLE